MPKSVLEKYLKEECKPKRRKLMEKVSIGKIIMEIVLVSLITGMYYMD